MDGILEIFVSLFYSPVGRLLFGQDFVDLAEPPLWQRIVVSFASLLVALAFILLIWFLIRLVGG
jgi:hypothetical protein